MNNIFLQKNNGCFSNNVENKLDVNFSTKVRLLNNEDLTREFSLIEQYNRERDECERFRLIVSINPICSNVLFNPKTEIVINEGSNDPKILCDCDKGYVYKTELAEKATNGKEKIEYVDAIRNTEYSHPELGNFKYHCGYDIFNNHMLRSDGYIHVNKLSTSNENGTFYNTILDYSRDKLGNEISQKLGAFVNNQVDTKLHLYRFDNILSMKQAFIERCEERDGWWGFINPNNMNIPNRSDEDILTNKLINDRSACDFIDLYPDRTLYSFIPKYNKYRNRLEKNWDYCITYPYKNDYDKINEICGGRKSSIRTNFIKRYNTSGVEVLECHSYFKHNLKPNDYINIYFYDYNDFQLYGKPVKVETIGDSVGDNTEKVFTIKYSNISSIYELLSDKSDNGVLKKYDLLKDVDNNSIYDGCLFFKKLTNGNECQYYFRKFKKLKNIDGTDIKSDINKVAFGKTIYGDDISQIIFTDDVNINGLVDNNNRPLTKVYLTIIKRNAGHDLWYKDYKYYGSDDSGKGDKKVEYSHCFGKVTSGLDFSGIKEEPLDYNIHRLHNLDFNDKLENSLDIETERFEIIKYEVVENDIILTIRVWDDTRPEEKQITLENVSDSEIRTFLMWGESVLKLPKIIEDDITIESFDEFYGDVVENDNTNCKETIISNIYHRVNTAQRECFDKCFRDLLQDRIIYDDYDIGIVEDAKDFTVKTYYINDVIDSESEWTGHTYIGQKNLVYGNIMPEGNFYNPHTQIDLKDEDGIISSSDAKLINYKENELYYDNEKNTLIINVPTNYGFYKGDYIAFYNSITNNTIWCSIVQTENNGFTLHILLNDIPFYKNDFVGNTKKYRAYWSPNNVPVYANFLPKTRKFVWRKILGQSELNQKSKLYDMTFSNGRLYIEKNINFFLRRQDPFGKYGLSKPITSVISKQYTNPSDDYSIPGDKQVDYTGLLYTVNNFENCY